MFNPAYDYDTGRDGPLSALHHRNANERYPGMIYPPFGWVELVLNLDAELSHVVPDYEIAQVKEKFGGLRFYIESFGIPRDDPRYDIARELIREAEEQSFHICQVCGEPGEINTDGWHRVLCEVHDEATLTT